MKPFVILTAILSSIILIVPTVLVVAFSSDESDLSANSTIQQQKPYEVKSEEQLTPKSNIAVSVFRTNEQTIEEIPIEEYVVGVIASEMPANFEIEALKAQALTARTYIIRQMLNPGEISLPDGAMVTDTQMHQVYKNREELEQAWGQDYEWKMARITEAVSATQGQVLTYENNPITATFFSTSNGFTENSEDYWQNSIPYLRSVESPWDKKSPRFKGEKIISVADFENILGVSIKNNNQIGKIIGRTDGGRVAKVNINGKTFTGREIREKLELESSDFSWKRKGNKIVINTKGWGHGVGMSQYGANGMALEGKTYQEIVSHYYQGVKISAVDPFVAKITEKQVAMK